ncbi:S-adenosyl methyltransferase [Saccharothrix saharensis]|uniref:S-adenosyl methyltransferase n=1 Tax=Saccharothrix saharensis TaxID=571190 RepID=A0A543J5Z8_9PSEU|nr:SAM-dependent methyltransferase [Saccharothrix saharensis]TQM78251.1 S-adenosyl methyltransferase [Saccharothrix saharensis]
MSDLDWVPDGIDTTVPSVARTYDYLLGGAHNLAVDRAMGEKMLQVLPGARDLVRLNRSFLRRAVTYLAERGVRQFLDIGSGIPTAGNVHEIAQEVTSGCRVVYVDKDPVATAHGRLLLAGDPDSAAVQADLREPDDVLGRPEVTRLLDFDEPVGLLLLLVVHFVRPEEDPGRLLARYRDRLAPGSFVVISHATADNRADTMRRAADTVRESRSKDNLVYRTHAEVTGLFDGYDLVPPGVVGHALWRPGGAGDIADRAEDNTQVWAGVGRKPGRGPVTGGRS